MSLDTRVRLWRLLVAGLVLCWMVGPDVYGEGSPRDDTLVLHYTFDYPDTTGLPGHKRIVKDHSPYGNDGEIVNKPEALRELDGRRGVLRFGGVETYVNCGNPESLHFDGDMSVEMWVRQNSLWKNPWGVIFGERGVPGFQFALENWINLALRCSDGRDVMIFPVDRDILGHEWSHIAVVVEYPRSRFYHNGKLVRDAYMPVEGVVKGRNGAKHVAEKCPIDLDELRVYRRALTAAEIAEHALGREVPPGREDELAVETHWYEETVTVRLSCKGTDYSDHTAEMTLLKGDYTDALVPQRIVLTESFEGSGRHVATAKFPLSGLENKSLDAVVRILDPDGKLVKKLNRHASLKKPEWVHTREGYSDEVLPPWTPVEAKRKWRGTVEVGVWGRRYVFSRAPFLRQIETRGKKILASPVTLKGRADGEPIAWKKGSVSLKETSKTAASLEQIGENDRATLRVNTRVEYDGYMTFECEVRARRDLSVEELTLEIPLRTRHDTLCHGDSVYPEDPKIPMNRMHTGAVRGDLAFRFSPNIWIGDEERGLCWQAESDEDWHYADKLKAIEILPRGKTTIFRANLVDVPTPLAAGEALHYKFALMATPMKPMLRDSWDLRIVRSDPYGEDLNLPDRKTNGKPTLQYYVDAGVRHLFINVADLWTYPMPFSEEFSEALHRLVEATHAHGLRLHPYLIHERFNVMAPEYDIHGLHMSSRPLRPWAYGGPGSPPAYIGYHGPVSTHYGAGSQAVVEYCAKSKAAQDAFIHSLARRFDIYGEDGVYLDGTMDLWNDPCKNTLHGCGYRAEDGSIQRTYPVFAVREFTKRIYAVVKQRRPDGVIDHHSWVINPAGLAYADMFWTGERWWHLKGKGAKDRYVAGELPLDMFRTGFMGYPLGVATEVLAYRLIGAQMGEIGRNKVSATSLLHDVPVRARTQDTPWFGTMIKFWRMRDRFGAKEAEKLFYWNNQDYVRVSPEECYATLFKHPKNGVLAFISNLRRDAQTVSAEFNLKKLGLRRKKLDVFNALTNEPVSMTSEGKLSVPLGSEEWAYIRLQPKAAKTD